MTSPDDDRLVDRTVERIRTILHEGREPTRIIEASVFDFAA
jgi:hypothetical protein